MRGKILVAGGAGYIGSTVARRLVREGHPTVVFDNLSTGYRRFVPGQAAFVKGDLRDVRALKRLFGRFRISVVMHFAASSLVGESVADPLKYYDNNVTAAIRLLEAMRRARVRRFIFSSTAATYGEPARMPIRETDPAAPANPYGRSKLAIEWMLEDCARAWGLRFISLRYFNACGADESGESGERHDPETHLIPNILKVLTGEKKELVVFGGDYPTRDGTCVRDFIHVDDLAEAHLRALEALRSGKAAGALNLGSARGYSILQVVRAVEKATGLSVRYRISHRRPGDPAYLVADGSRARRLLGWKPRRTLEEIIRSAWNFECRNSVP